VSKPYFSPGKPYLYDPALPFSERTAILLIPRDNPSHDLFYFSLDLSDPDLPLIHPFDYLLPRIIPPTPPLFRSGPFPSRGRSSSKWFLFPKGYFPRSLSRTQGDFPLFDVEDGSSGRIPFPRQSFDTSFSPLSRRALQCYSTALGHLFFPAPLRLG